MADPQWLDDAEMRAWRAFLVAATRVNQALDRDLQDGFGRSLAEYEVLVNLSEASDRRRRMAELAELSLQTRSRLTHTVDRLEAEGLIERIPCEDDRRGTWAVLTDEGFAHLAEMAPDHVASVRRRLLDPLTSTDVVALGRALGKVVDALAADGCPPEDE